MQVLREYILPALVASVPARKRAAEKAACKQRQHTSRLKARCNENGKQREERSAEAACEREQAQGAVAVHQTQGCSSGHGGQPAEVQEEQQRLPAAGADDWH